MWSPGGAAGPRSVRISAPQADGWGYSCVNTLETVVCTGLYWWVIHVALVPLGIAAGGSCYPHVLQERGPLVRHWEGRGLQPNHLRTPGLPEISSGSRQRAAEFPSWQPQAKAPSRRSRSHGCASFAPVADEVGRQRWTFPTPKSPLAFRRAPNRLRSTHRSLHGRCEEPGLDSGLCQAPLAALPHLQHKARAHLSWLS